METHESISGSTELQPRRRRSKKWKVRSRRRRVILVTVSVVIVASAILSVVAFEWLLDQAVR